MGIEQRVRLPAIDYLKAASIVGVALIHAGRPFWDPRHGPWDLWISAFLPQFAVPAFFFASGFLYQRAEPIPWSDVSRRLQRVLVPYLVASGAVMALGWAQTQKPRAIVEELLPALSESPLALHALTAGIQILTGSALEIYYFIFLIALLIPTIFLLSRLATRTLVLALASLALVPIAIDASFALGLREAKPSGMDLFWAARNPFLGAAPMFLAGWVAAIFRPEIMSWIDARKPMAVGLCLLPVLLHARTTAAADPWIPHLTVRFTFTLSVIALSFIFARAASPGRLVTELSDSSLAIYLYHFLFILMALPWLDSLPSGLRLLALATLALVGSMTLIASVRLALGARARTWLGA